MKIGLMGGTFDPPHIGHLIIAEQAFAQLGLDAIWFAPVGSPPHKDNRRVTPVHHRVAMTRLAIQDNPHFVLSQMDVDRPTPHYIVTLFDLLVQQHPDVEWFLIIGGDSLSELPHWYQPERLLKLARLAVAQRPGFQPNLDEIEKALPGTSTRVEWVDSPLIDLASRDLQRRVREGLPLRYVVPQDVLGYIVENHLYHRDDSQGVVD